MRPHGRKSGRPRYKASGRLHYQPRGTRYRFGRQATPVKRRDAAYDQSQSEVTILRSTDQPSRRSDRHARTTLQRLHRRVPQEHSHGGTDQRDNDTFQHTIGKVSAIMINVHDREIVAPILERIVQRDENAQCGAKNEHACKRTQCVSSDADQV